LNSSGVTKLITAVMLAGRLQILADGQEIDIGGAQVVHQLQHFVPLLAEADHDAGLGEHGRVEFLDPLQQADRMEIAGAGADRQIVADGTVSRLWLKTSGLAATTRSSAPSLRRKSGVRISMVVAGRRRADGPDHLAKCSAPPSARSSRSTEVMTTWLRPIFFTALATLLRLLAVERQRHAGRTLQKAQARVQISPMIMKVACFLSQHSPIFGQPASSQTVTRCCGCWHSRANSARAHESSRAWPATWRRAG
jgi:hypothetical protein